MMPTPRQIADAMIAEIRCDVLEGVVPSTTRDFCELHDYVDANCYGGSESLFEQFHDVVPDTDEGHTSATIQFFSLMNPAIELVDQWIRQGGIRKGFVVPDR